MSINMVNPYRDFEISQSIVEWDIKRAGISLIKHYQLLPEKVINDFSSLPKKESDIAIGKYQLKYREFSKNLEQAFTDIMNEFLSLNNIDTDIDILSIKKDACFVINKDIMHPEIGEFVKFIPKNAYHSYIRIPKYEFYINDEFDIKGLTSDKERRSTLMQLHKDGMISFLRDIVDLLKEGNPSSLNKYMKEFLTLYKRKELPFDYYREFNYDSTYRVRMGADALYFDNIEESFVDGLDIEFNYLNIILPLIKLIY